MPDPGRDCRGVRGVRGVFRGERGVLDLELSGNLLERELGSG